MEAACGDGGHRFELTRGWMQLSIVVPPSNDEVIASSGEIDCAPSPEAPLPSLGGEKQPLCLEPWRSLYILRRG